MRIPYGYDLIDGQLIVNEEKAETVRQIFAYYLAGASLGKVVDMLERKGICSPTGNAKWTRAAIDKLLSNAKYIPIVGFEAYMEVDLKKIGDAMWTMTRQITPEKQYAINRLR